MMDTTETVEWVRVKDSATGHQYTVTRNIAEGSKNLTVVDRPAVNSNAEPLPPKFAVNTPTGETGGDAQGDTATTGRKTTKTEGK